MTWGVSRLPSPAAGQRHVTHHARLCRSLPLPPTFCGRRRSLQIGDRDRYVVLRLSYTPDRMPPIAPEPMTRLLESGERRCRRQALRGDASAASYSTFIQLAHLEQVGLFTSVVAALIVGVASVPACARNRKGGRA